jgi:hypothetical protein
MDDKYLEKPSDNLQLAGSAASAQHTLAASKVSHLMMNMYIIYSHLFSSTRSWFYLNVARMRSSSSINIQATSERLPEQ